MTAGNATARAYMKREPHFCSSGPIILGKMNATSCSSESTRQFLPIKNRDISCVRMNRRRCNSLVSYLKRWIAEIWYSVIRRLKSMFSTRLDPDENLSKTVKVPPSEIDSELENAFWREGIQRLNKIRGPFTPRMSACWDHRYSGLGDHVDVFSPYRKTGLVTDCQETHRTSSECHSDCEFKKQLGSFSTSLGSPQSFDEEYSALYETKTVPRSVSDSGRISSKKGGKFGNSNSDRSVPSTTRLKKENCGGRVSSESDGSDDRSKPFSGLKSKSNPLEARETAIAGEWVQMARSESVWYSKSELNAALAERKSTARRTRASSRIPRLCSKSKKSFPEHC